MAPPINIGHRLTDMHAHTGNPNVLMLMMMIMIMIMMILFYTEQQRLAHVITRNSIGSACGGECASAKQTSVSVCLYLYHMFPSMLETECDSHCLIASSTSFIVTDMSGLRRVHDIVFINPIHPAVCELAKTRLDENSFTPWSC